jgi:hypothetical protein
MTDPGNLELASPSHRNQNLFSDHYLNEILKENPRWAALRDLAQPVLEQIAAILKDFAPSDNERQTEENLVMPVLKLLGHTFEVQPSLKTSEGAKTPDYVFYNDTDAIRANKNKLLTDALPQQGGIAIGDAKHWNRPLDIAVRQPTGDALSNKNPSYQIWFYMLHSGVTWGILTNGKKWRLYHRDTAHKLDHFYEVDLGDLVKPDGAEGFPYFYAFFRREAFDPGPLSLENILRESVEYALSIGNSLKNQVYEALRHIAQGFLDYAPNRLQPDPATLKTIYDHSLVVLYRLIFILYAEARELLPVRENQQYRDIYSLHAIKHRIAEDLISGRHYLPTSDVIWPRLDRLFSDINEGNPPLNVATYNGGLFDPEKYEFLTRHTVGDGHLQQAIDKLARVNGEFVDYRDLSVQHMGTIYEGLLEYGLQALSSPEEGWAVGLVNDKGERKATGSYYTPDYIVKYIVEHTVGPVLERAIDGKKTDAEKLDAVLDTNVLDPAMGSGHFLVEATEFIARSLVDLGVAPEGKTPDEADLAYWKRRVVQSCMYGVDLNPLAVELAKLSLWLTTVAKDRPLSFLDHHLRPGNSLVGARLKNLRLRKGPRKKPKPNNDQANGQISLFTDSDFAQRVSTAVGFMEFIEASDASDVAQVRAQEKAYEQLREQLADKYARLLNVVTAAQVGMEIEPKYRVLLQAYLASSEAAQSQALEELMDRADAMAEREHFFHWEIEFPEMYFDRVGRPLGDEGGFDAVVGNPPWERIKLQENEFFAARDNAIALAPKASERKRLIAELREGRPELWREYETERIRADNLLSYVRDSGYYPLMGRGDTNYYALFAERALQMVEQKGRIGLLVPSGIATDDTTKDYFQHVVDQHMLAELLDFENREALFPEVHRSFKFSVILLAGEGSPQKSIRCGFFLHNMREATDPDRISLLSPSDFRLFNPNTLTTPIFRRRRDAELTRKIYKAAPVLINRSGDKEVNPWNVRLATMFHMTNDSHLFRTAAQLEEEGYWLGAGNIYTMGDTRYLSLYEGKMVQMYDHRAASIVVNPENLFRPAQQEPTTPEQHSDPDFSPACQFWASANNVTAKLNGYSAKWHLGFKEITAPTNERTVIAAALPPVAFGNKIPLVLLTKRPAGFGAAALLANLNSFVLDYAARQKIGGQTLNFFIVEQFPVLPPGTYKREWQGIVLGEFIKERVLELCYTAHDLKGFAKDMGYDGPSFAWDEERRLHLRCQLDALYFHLYGLTRSEAAEILDTFPIVKRQDEAAFGKYRTKELILAYYKAYAAGNMDAWAKR